MTSTEPLAPGAVILLGARWREVAATVRACLALGCAPIVLGLDRPRADGGGGPHGVDDAVLWSALDGLAPPGRLRVIEGDFAAGEADARRRLAGHCAPAGWVLQLDAGECPRADDGLAAFLAACPQDAPLALAAEDAGAEPAPDVRAIAFYLPQFHPIPENDAWWGKGFTEWRNVVRAAPLFDGHHQPQLPADLGFYDLRVPEVRAEQAALARRYGIHGFCYYHYWFDGRRLLETPLDAVLASGEPDFPFCLCWANEHWTRRWDGGSEAVLIAQHYSPDNDLRFIRDLYRYFADRRYIRVDGRPLLLVYRSDLLPDVAATLARWREAARADGIGELYLVRVESFVRADAAALGFDAGCEFPPLLFDARLDRARSGLTWRRPHAGPLHDYAAIVAEAQRRPIPSYRLLRGVMPGWDNTARRGEEALVFVGNTPERYRDWLRFAVADTRARLSGDERLVFINAWNEWAEGTHLEPDLRDGHAYLEATREALGAGRPAAEVAPPPRPAPAAPPRPEPVSAAAVAPRVSVIIPVYNQLDFTLRCLAAIARHPPRDPVEIIVVDDGSTDATPATLAPRADLVYLRNPHNLGFVGACNAGAARARGDYLCFLNNDTEVRPGWLDALVDTFAQIPDAGLVGAKLIYPDGRLQEAGGVIWDDASGLNYGRGQDPNAPAFNFLRDVDYCSGAAILVPRAPFAELGGFDARYAPAYYEDTDLAFALRARGRRVLYQPRAEVVHFEGATAGTDVTTGAKAHQVANRATFLQKWAAVLPAHGRPGLDPRRAADRRPQRRVLIVDATTPTPDQDSGSVDMVNLMRLFDARGWRVTFVPLDLVHLGRYTHALQAQGIECLYLAGAEPAPAETAQRFLETLLTQRAGELDLAIVSRLPVAARALATVQRLLPHTPVVFNTVDLHFLRERRHAELIGNAAAIAHAAGLEAAELDCVRRADLTVVISPAEAALLAARVPAARIAVLPLIRDIPGRSGGYSGRHGAVFVGGFRHPPNLDAVRWLCAEIWPRVRARLPGAELEIVGSQMPAELAALEGEGVRLTGWVEDLAPVFARRRVSLAPLRFGAGLKGKIATSLGYGVPVVATTLAAEGMEDVAGVLVADDPAAFADAVVRLHEAPADWGAASAAGLAAATAAWGLEAVDARLGALLDELLALGAARRQAAAQGAGTATPEADYAAWRARHRRDAAARARLVAAAPVGTRPCVQVLLPFAPGDEARLADTVDALAAQTPGRWRLDVVAAIACPDPLFEELDVLAWHRHDGDEAAALAAAAAQAAADWRVVARPGTRFEPDFADVLAAYAGRHPEWRCVTFDEDRVDAAGRCHTPLFKPDANLDLLYSGPYTGHACAIHHELWPGVGGLPVPPLLLNYAAALVCCEHFGSAALGHVDELLWHHPEGAPDATATVETLGADLLRTHLEAVGEPAAVLPGLLPGTFFIDHPLPAQPLVSVIVPTKDRLDLLAPCIDSLLERTAYRHFEVLIVDNGSTEPATRAWLAAIGERDRRVRVLDQPVPYNFSALNNAAAAEARGEFLLLLNNDTVIVQPQWLERMLAQGLRPGVGAVGCRLVFPDGRVQHAGVVLGLSGTADHVGIALALDAPGHLGRAQRVQDFSAVTAACLLVRREVYAAVGGLDETRFAVLFNDVDLCLKVGALGLRVVWTPFATVLHHGSSSLRHETDPARLARNRRSNIELVRQWLPQLARDPAYNRNLSLSRRDWALDEQLDAPWNPDLPTALRVIAAPCNAGGTGQYRVRGPLRALAAAGRAQHALLPDHDRAAPWLPEPADLARRAPHTLLLQNAFTEQHLRALEVYREVGLDAFVVFGQDDLVFELPKRSALKGEFAADTRKRLRQVLRLCDRLVVATPAMAAACADLAGDIRVVPNYIEAARWRGLPPPPDACPRRRPRVGWAGAAQHQGDLALLVDVVRATAHEVDWVFFGMCIDALAPHAREIHPGVPFDAYPAALARLDLDLAVAPLEHNRFNAAKSNLRLLEYGMLGWPVIASDIEPYRGAPVTRVANNPAAWLKALREHLADPAASARAGADLHAWVHAHWLLEDHLDEWLGALTRGG